MRKTTDTVCNAYGVKFNLVSFLQLGNQDRSCVKGSTSFLYAPFFLSSRMFFAVICTQMHNSHTARSRANTHIRMVHSVQRSQRVLSEVPQSVRKKKHKVKECDERRRRRKVRAVSWRLSPQSPVRHKISCMSTQHRLTTFRPRTLKHELRRKQRTNAPFEIHTRIITHQNIFKRENKNANFLVCVETNRSKVSSATG